MSMDNLLRRFFLDVLRAEVDSETAAPAVARTARSAADGRHVGLDGRSFLMEEKSGQNLENAQQYRANPHDVLLVLGGTRVSRPCA